jgi:hypothetical protein
MRAPINSESHKCVYGRAPFDLEVSMPEDACQEVGSGYMRCLVVDIEIYRFVLDWPYNSERMAHLVRRTLGQLGNIYNTSC